MSRKFLSSKKYIITKKRTVSYVEFTTWKIIYVQVSLLLISLYEFKLFNKYFTISSFNLIFLFTVEAMFLHAKIWCVARFGTICTI